MLTMSKKTVPQIKTELDNLGVEYKHGQRKAELLTLLEEKSVAEVDDHYSPPYTRNRTTMSAFEIKASLKTSLKLDDSPVNHASAVIEELENDVNNSEEASVDVQIVREGTPAAEEVVARLSSAMETSEEVSELSEEITEEISEITEEISEISEQTNSDAELEGELELTPETHKVTRSVTKRRSERIKQHSACKGALFSDDETSANVEVVEDETSTASAEDTQTVTARRTLLIKIFLFSILFAIVANLIAYVHLSRPEILAGIQQKAVSFLRRFRPAASEQSAPSE